MTTAPNTINALFAHMDEINAKTAEQLSSDDITTTIAFHREQRRRRAAGEKVDKPKSTVDISAILGNIITKPKGPVAAVFRRKL